MKENQLTEDSNFEVKESVTFDLLIGLFFFALFFYSLYSTIVPEGDRQLKVFQRMLLVVLVPALSFTIKGLQNKVAITINKEGIYYYKKFITNWQNLAEAYITQDEITGSIQDNFVLMVKYLVPGDGYYVLKMKLTNTQDKSEEEVMAAIQFFKTLAEKA